MSLYILNTALSSFRSLLRTPKVGYTCLNKLNKKNSPFRHWKSLYKNGCHPENFKLKSTFSGIRKSTGFSATVFPSYFIPRKLPGRLMSTMDNAADVSHTSCPNNIDNEKSLNALKDNKVNTSEMAPNEENIKKEEKTVEDKKLSESKNVSNDGKVCEGDNNKEKANPQKFVSASASMSKRALRKWKKQQRKGFRETGPLTTNPDPGYGSDVLAETEYYFEDGLRKVYPYYHTFTSYVKGRWLKRTVLDVFTKEFHVASQEDLLQDIKTGLLRVNDKIITADYKLKFNDFMSHRIHRHENPVVNTKLEIIEDNEHVIVVNKPSSIPCHPCGRYRYNSVVFILGKEYGYSNLRNIYRLDRLTSGVLICAKTSEKTRELEDQILNKLVKKEYVCRVVGKFPEGEIEVDQPLECINHKISLWQIRESGKPSKTSFKRLSYNGTSSVVQCFPLTGRTHQIRIHLQYLGHPILNDPLYSGDAWGPDSAKGKIFKCTIDEDKIAEAVIKNHNIGLWEKGPHPLFQLRVQQMKEAAALKEAALKEAAALKEDTPMKDADEMKEDDAVKEAAVSTTNLVSGSDKVEKNNPLKEGEGLDKVEEPPLKRLKMNDGSSTSPKGKVEESHPAFDLQKWIPCEKCIHCKTEYIDPQPKDLIMYLHALSYKGPDWEYRTGLPDWAQPDWKEEC